MLEGALRARVITLGAATIDRLLAPCRAALGRRGRRGTRPGTLLRQQIPVHTEHWDVEGPGWIEADTVAHRGKSMAGDVASARWRCPAGCLRQAVSVRSAVWSVTMTDAHTQWTETRAARNRGQHGIQTRIAEVEKARPFSILGFDSDSGGEFLNRLLGRVCKRRS